VGRPHNDPVPNVTAANSSEISALAPARTSQPGVRRRSHIAEATVVMKQPVYRKLAAGTWIYMSRTESAISASGGLHTRPYITNNATLPSANTPRTRLARDPVWPGAPRPAAASAASDTPPSP
jgi:hypothetical protein